MLTTPLKAVKSLDEANTYSTGNDDEVGIVWERDSRAARRVVDLSFDADFHHTSYQHMLVCLTTILYVGIIINMKVKLMFNRIEKLPISAALDKTTMFSRNLTPTHEQLIQITHRQLIPARSPMVALTYPFSGFHLTQQMNHIFYR